MYNFNRNNFSLGYPNHTSSVLHKKKNYNDKSNLHIAHKILTVGDLNNTDFDKTELQGDGFLGDIAKFGMQNLLGPALQGVLGSLGGGLNPPGTGLSPPGSGLLDTAMYLNDARGTGSYNFKHSFPPAYRSVSSVEGDGLGKFLRKLKKRGMPAFKKYVLPKAKKALLPLIEHQLEKGLALTKKKLENTPLGDVSHLLPADKLKMGVLKKLKGGASPKLQIYHPSMENMSGGQLGMLAMLASQFLLPAIGGVVKNLLK